MNTQALIEALLTLLAVLGVGAAYLMPHTLETPSPRPSPSHYEGPQVFASSSIPQASTSPRYKVEAHASAKFANELASLYDAISRGNELLALKTFQHLRETDRWALARAINRDKAMALTGPSSHIGGTVILAGMKDNHRAETAGNFLGVDQMVVHYIDNGFLFDVIDIDNDYEYLPDEGENVNIVHNYMEGFSFQRTLVSFDKHANEKMSTRFDAGNYLIVGAKLSTDYEIPDRSAMTDIVIKAILFKTKIH